MYIQYARKMRAFPGLDSITLCQPHQEFQLKSLTSGPLWSPACQIMSPKSSALAHPADKSTVGISTAKLEMTVQRSLFSLEVPSKEFFMCSWSRQGLEETGRFPWAHQQLNLKCGERYKTEEEVVPRSPGRQWRFPGLELSLGKRRWQTTKKDQHCCAFTHVISLSWTEIFSFPNMKILFGTHVPSL